MNSLPTIKFRTRDLGPAQHILQFDTGRKAAFALQSACDIGSERVITRHQDSTRPVGRFLVATWLNKGLGCSAALTLFALINASPWTNNVRPKFELTPAKSANDPALRNRIVRLGPSVSADEAQRVTYCAYTTGRELAREWRVFWMAGVQNFLVNTGSRKGGLCFQWANELLLRLDALKLQTLELHWAESYAGTVSEHNVIVVTAKGQPFEKGILLDNWRYEGRLIWGPITGDTEYRWKENPAELARRLSERKHYGLPGIPEPRTPVELPTPVASPAAPSGSPIPSNVFTR